MTIAEFVVPGRWRTDRRSPSRWLVSHVRHHAWLVAVALLGAFGNAALAGVVPLEIGRAFQAIAGQVPAARSVLISASLTVAISQIARAGLQLGRNFASELLAQRLERDIRDELCGSLLGKSMTFHTLQPVGDSMARATNDVREINLMFNPGLNLVIGSANFLIVPILFAGRYHPQLVLTPIAFSVLYFWSLRRYLRRLRPIAQEARAAFGRMNAHLAETIDGIEVVKSCGQEAGESERFQANALGYRNAFVHQGEEEARFVPLLLLGLAIAAGLGHALLLVRAGHLDVGQVVGYVGLLQLFGFPVYVSLFAYGQVASGLASAERILELITRRTDVDQNRAGHAAPVRGRIEFRDATFGYEAERPILRDLNFVIEPGETVAVVGQTGSGKTTLARLVNRTYDVERGSVRVDGVDVRQWQLESLRRQVSIIEQDVFLFSTTIAENIAFGRPDASRDEIIAVAQAAQAHQFILALPNGYDTVIGQRGVTLSGGQRQRLAIARALLTQPRILIIDDATSALDSATEDCIQRAMRVASQGRTTLLITHRLAQIRKADRVLVLRAGRVEAFGPHAALLTSCRFYRRIFELYADEPVSPSGA